MDFSAELRALFYLGDVEDRFEEVMPKWFQLYEDHRPVQNLLFGALFVRHLYAEDRFLNLARALEVYHRVKHSGGNKPKKEFKAVRDEILGQVDEKHREWLKVKLAWANELTLHERLKHLLNELGELNLSEALGVSEEAVAKRIKDTRNHLTHYSKKSKAIPAEEMNELSFLMEYLLQALLLKEIGFSAAKIKDSENYSYRMEQIAKALSHP